MQRTPPHYSTVALAARVRAAGRDLPRWLQVHPCLQAVPVEQGESSVVLLLLWEADHGRRYPSHGLTDWD